MKSRRANDDRIPRARRLRRDMTDVERKLWQRLRAWPDVTRAHFRRQATLGPYFADFACHSSRLVVELDGGQHAEGAQKTRDQKRDAYFESQGYRVLRFWNVEVSQNIEGVMSVIADAVRSASPPTPDPSPPPSGGRGGSHRP